MYGGEDSSNNGSNINSRETLQLSPHIAAHKSSTCTTQVTLSSLNNFISQSSSNSINQHTLKRPHNEAYVTHSPVYRAGIPTSAIYKATIESNEISSNNGHNTPQVVNALPQDLSSNANKPISISNSDQKSLSSSHIHPVVSQGDGYGAPVLVTERPPTYYRLVDGTTIAIAGQHQTVLLSTLNNDPINSIGVQSCSSLLSPEGANPVATQASMTGTANTLPVHDNPPVSADSNIIIPDVLPSNLLNSQDILSIKEHLDSKRIKEEEEDCDQKDLVKQALQAAVVHNNQRGPADQEVLDYNYSTGEIAGAENCLVPEDIICHSTFCPQNNFKSQDLLLMNIHTQNAGQNTTKQNGIGLIPNLTETSQGNQVVYVHSSSGILEESGGSTFIISPNKRRRTKATEAVQAARRERIACRMREKRANESDDQKLKRRIREAERMRRKRAMEDEDSKTRRRREAAERARIRRAKLSPHEKELERQKAARRMRLRRQNEDDEQKRLRRSKAAERMRKRRSIETPEQRAARKQNLALRMKAKRRKKEDHLKTEPFENVLLFDPEVQRDDSMSHPEVNREGVIVSEAPSSHFLSHGHLITVPANLAFLQSDNSTSHSTTDQHIIPMDLASIPSTVTFRQRNVMPTISHKIEDDNDGLPIHKLAVISQGLSAANVPDVQAHVSRSVMTSSPSEPISLHKSISTSLVNTHPLPHILHNHHSLSPSPTTQDPHQTVINENHSQLPHSHHQPNYCSAN